MTSPHLKAVIFDVSTSLFSRSSTARPWLEPFCSPNASLPPAPSSNETGEDRKARVTRTIKEVMEVKAVYEEGCRDRANVGSGVLPDSFVLIQLGKQFTTLRWMISYTWSANLVSKSEIFQRLPPGDVQLQQRNKCS